MLDLILIQIIAVPLMICKRELSFQPQNSFRLNSEILLVSVFYAAAESTVFFVFLFKEHAIPVYTIFIVHILLAGFA